MPKESQGGGVISLPALDAFFEVASMKNGLR